MSHRKDKKPEETIKYIENILKLNQIDYKITSDLNNFDFFYSVRVEVNRNGFIIGANGKGMTRELALASGLAELMERLQTRNGMKFWYSTKYYPKRAFVCEYKSSEAVAKEISDDFDKYNVSDLYQYRIDYTNEKTQKSISVPNRLLNLFCGSNGLCAGNSREEAVVQGVSEIFERYVRKLISKEHIRCPYIEKNELKKYSFYEKMRCFEERGFIWEAVDCTNGNKYPVVGLIVLDRSKSKYLFVLGADVDFEIALERCITELLQGKTIEKLIHSMKIIDFENIGKEEVNWLLEGESDYYDFVDNYISNSGNNPVYLFFENEKEKVSIPSIFHLSKDNKEAYEYILKIVGDNKLDIYVGDFSYLGFPTYRVYIPKLSRVFEMEEGSFRFVDYLQHNVQLLMKINDLSFEEKDELIYNLISLSKNYIYRRNSFASIIFRFCGGKDFDFNFLYLDFVIALLLMSKYEYTEALKYYTRFIKEHRIFEMKSENELLKVLYVYLKELARGTELGIIKSKCDFIFQRSTNQYVYEFIKFGKCLEMVYWPVCPNCPQCPYEKDCIFQEWVRIDSILKEKQRQYYNLG